ncbi:hypothetical protein BDR06DRAFT_353641 [Suillus hirtellus]|nr:hypothetical protein BDR06DRAFT_353641 [Suillus hirtellus]
MPLQSTCSSAFRRSDNVELSHEDSPLDMYANYDVNARLDHDYGSRCPDLLKFLWCFEGCASIKTLTTSTHRQVATLSITIMQLSLIFRTLMFFAAIVAAYSPLDFGKKHTSVAKREGLDFDLTRQLNVRAPDVSHVSAPNDPDDPVQPNDPFESN